MDLLTNYIPQEHLALKINYCRQQLKMLPVIKLHNQNKNGEIKTRVIVDSHRYDLTSEKGKQYAEIFRKRNQLELSLQFYESMWKRKFIDDVPEELYPRKANRFFYTEYNLKITMDKAFFDSLKNDANSYYAKNGNYPFNGIYYRSAAERDIAIFYTNMGIPFKYEPEVMLKGMNRPVYPDFVIYIEELDTCIFHEHFGIKESSTYLKDTRIKYENYAVAGLVPELDILFTHDTNNMPFDIRYLSAKLNTAVYGIMISNRNPL